MADHHRYDGGWQFRQRHGEHDKDLAEEPRINCGWNCWKELLENGVRVVIKTTDGMFTEMDGKVYIG